MLAHWLMMTTYCAVAYLPLTIAPNAIVCFSKDVMIESIHGRAQIEGQASQALAKLREDHELS